MGQLAMLVGHSFVYFLQDFVHHESEWYNLGLDGTDIEIDYAGISGGILRNGPQCFYSRNNMAALYMRHSDIVYLQVGDNVLCQSTCVPEILWSAPCGHWPDSVFLFTMLSDLL